MDLDSLGRSPIGDLVHIDVPASELDGQLASYWAFAPAPLPDEPSLGLATLNVSTQAAMAVARLDQAMAQLPNPGLLLRPIIRREAVSTSALEGTYAAFDEVLESDFLEEKQMSAPQREIQNFVRAVDLATELLKTRPISRGVAGQLQKLIVRGTPGDTYEAGDLRKRQVYIGSRGRNISSARFIPCPPGDRLEEGFSDWEKWLNERNDIPIVVRMALAHYQFETLHPFNDGNGRLGRLISVLQLVEDGVLKMPALNLSPWLEARRDAYIDGLLEVSKTGEFDPWIEFFSTAVLEQANEGVQVISDLLNFRERTIIKLRSENVRGSALQIVENLIGYPVIDVPTARRLTGKTFQAANNAINNLVDHGILREVTGKPINRLFACMDVLRIINRRQSG
jgi:Fic family protein